jgi:hypothetical protein
MVVDLVLTWQAEGPPPDPCERPLTLDAATTWASHVNARPQNLAARGEGAGSGHCVAVAALRDQVGACRLPFLLSATPRDPPAVSRSHSAGLTHVHNTARPRRLPEQSTGRGPLPMEK